jgi:hypothetical protein
LEQAEEKKRTEDRGGRDRREKHRADRQIVIQRSGQRQRRTDGKKEGDRAGKRERR